MRVDGKRTSRKLRTEDGEYCSSHAEAEEALERLRGELADRADLRAGKRAHLGDWLEQEYESILKARMAPHGAGQATTYIGKFVAWMELEDRDVEMSEVTRSDVERFCAAFIAEGYRASYLRRFINVLRKAWNDAIERGFATKNPWHRVLIPRIEETHVPWVAAEDLARLCAAVNREQRPLVTLIAETGLRPSEALALRREDVELERELLHVRRGKSRAARRTVPLTPGALKVLRAQRKRDDGLVFEPRTTHGTLKALATACRHAKLPPLTLRSLRHVYASHLIVAGTPPTVVAALLGHADGGALVLRLYGRWFPQDAQNRAIAALHSFRSIPGTAPVSPRARGRRSGPADGSAGATTPARRSRG
ncbi:MAG TPA: tyrosine-type recombinase/integrase [Vicinamibacterales bacterium]|nr:tyrosine-type recombinase/integrase [Vicinamibacterales bacterium]